MYSQFAVDERDRKFQLAFWRENDTNILQVYQLNTVTLGVLAAPFLAIRSLFHIANLNELEYPLADTVLRTDLYVDDLLTGADHPLPYYKRRRKS